MEKELCQELKKLILKIEAATIEIQHSVDVEEDSDGSLVVIRSPADYQQIKSESHRRQALFRAARLSRYESRCINEAHSYRDDAVQFLRIQQWNRAVYMLENAAFHEEDCGRPYAITFLPLLEELEALLFKAGIAITSRRVKLNRIVQGKDEV